MGHSKINIAMIDPVGIKAGMDHYDMLLLSGIQHENYCIELFSNFTSEKKNVKVKQVFFNTGVSKVSAITSNFVGFFKALRICKSNKTEWIMLHVFRAGLFDLFTFGLTRMMGFKICAIVHDIESLDTLTLPAIRKIVIGKLPHLRIVHNEFCKSELIKSMDVPIEKSTKVIPHVHFKHLFTAYQEVPGMLEQLKDNPHLPGKIHPQLSKCIQDKTPIFLFFGQIKKAKGLEILLEALSQSTTNFKLIIAGKVRDDQWSRYQDIITVLNLKDRVFPVIRHISDEERDYLFSISKAIILPYTRIYQSGVLLMAMSFPKLVLASDLAPNAELISHNKNGLLFQAGNPTELAKKIDALQCDTLNTNSIEQQAFKDIEEFYSPEKIGVLYREVLVK